MTARPTLDQARWTFHLISLLGTPPGILLMVILVATLDLATTWEVPLGLFYLVPITFVATYHTWSRVQLAVLLSVAGWTVVDIASLRPVSHAVVPVVNVLIRILLLGGMGWFIFRARHTQAREKDLVQFVLHDLRNPVTALGLAIEGLSEGDPAFPSARLLTQSRHALLRIRSLIDALLGLTRLERGGLEVRRDPILVSQMIQAAVDTFQPLAEARDLAIEAVPGAPGLRALGDDGLLQRMLENLIANAIKVSAAGAAIRVSYDATAQGEVVLRVSDQGPGIPETMARKIFDPYVQLELNRTGADRGTGLGLAFCRAAVHSMGGRIWVESQAGGGATLAVSLASATPDLAATPSTAPSADPDPDPPYGGTLSERALVGFLTR